MDNLIYIAIMENNSKEALEALRKKYLEVIGKEPGKTLGAAQLSKAIANHLAENGGDGANNPGSGEGDSGNGDGAGEGSNENGKPPVVDPAGAGTPGAGDPGSDPGANAGTANMTAEELQAYVADKLKAAGLDENMKVGDAIGIVNAVIEDEESEEALDLLKDFRIKLENRHEIAVLAGKALESLNNEENQPLHNPNLNRTPITKEDLKTELIWIVNKKTKGKKQISKITWEKFLGKAPGNWKLLPGTPPELKELK